MVNKQPIPQGDTGSQGAWPTLQGAEEILWVVDMSGVAWGARGMRPSNTGGGPLGLSKQVCGDSEHRGA